MKIKFPLIIVGLLCLWLGPKGIEILQLTDKVNQKEAKLSDLRKEFKLSENENGQLNGLESFVGDVAKRSGVRFLSSLSIDDSNTFKLVNIEWEARQKNSLKFIQNLQYEGPLGACLKLQIKTLSQSPGYVRARAVFLPKQEKEDKQKTELQYARDVFRPLWLARKKEKKIDRSKELREQQEKQRLEAEQLAMERREKQKIKQLETKKRNLRNQLVLKGIVNNGQESLAFIGKKGARSQDLMVKTGDVIEEAEITAINESKGEVILDYQNQFQVVLRINSLSLGVR